MSNMHQEQKQLTQFAVPGGDACMPQPQDGRAQMPAMTAHPFVTLEADDGTIQTLPFSFYQVDRSLGGAETLMNETVYHFSAGSRLTPIRPQGEEI